MRTLAVLLLAVSVLAQGNHRKENRALLGVVAVPAPSKKKRKKRKTIVVAHVLKKSPADRVGIKVGDELVSIAGNDIRRPEDVDAALKPFAGKEKVEVAYRRDKKTKKVEIKLVARKDYRGDFLDRQSRGRTGVKAPEWFVYAWARAGDEPPTRANTKGKVVVIHCFQSW